MFNDERQEITAAATVREVSALVLSSPRLRRRIGWALVLLVGITAIVLASVLMPSHSRTVAEERAAESDAPAAVVRAARRRTRIREIERSLEAYR